MRYLLMGIVFMLCANSGFAHPVDKEHDAYHARLERTKKIVDAEVQRAHELKIAREANEIYAQQLRLQATRVNAYARSSNLNQILLHNTNALSQSTMDTQTTTVKTEVST